jgi:hypothetical protein
LDYLTEVKRKEGVGEERNVGGRGTGVGHCEDEDEKMNMKKEKKRE